MIDVSSTTPARERGVRARRQREAQRTHGVIAGIERQIPTYDLLGEEGLVRIEAAADTILQEIGIEFRGDEEALRLWREAGADVGGELVRFPIGLMR
jgi:trimethylamine--corrinoid protein Co-methyltransferase